MGSPGLRLAPLISVIMPVYNGERFLGAAMRSILRQSFDDLELIVVDDGSTDASAALASAVDDPRVRVIKADHGGEGAARNRGIDEARGAWVAWHDADDVALPDRLRMLLDAVSSGADFAHSDMLFIDHEDHPLGYLRSSSISPRHVLPHLVREGTPFNNGSMMVRRSSIGELRFDTTLGLGVDTDFVRRLAPGRTGVHVPEPLSMYRIHPSSTSSGHTPDRDWHHVGRLLDAETPEVLVPEAYRSGFSEPDRVAAALLGLSLARRGFVFQAQERLESALAGTVAPDVAPLVGASVELSARAYQRAAARLAAAPPSAPTLALLGDACAGSGDLVNAMRSYMRCLEIDPENYDGASGVRALGEAMGTRAVDDARRRILGPSR